MSRAEINKLKLELIGWISELSDKDQLVTLDAIRRSNAESERNWWNELTEAQRAHIQEGIDDADAGRVHASEEFWKRIKNAKKKPAKSRVD